MIALAAAAMLAGCANHDSDLHAIMGTPVVHHAVHPYTPPPNPLGDDRRSATNPDRIAEDHAAIRLARQDAYAAKFCPKGENEAGTEKDGNYSIIVHCVFSVIMKDSDGTVTSTQSGEDGILIDKPKWWDNP